MAKGGFRKPGQDLSRRTPPANHRHAADSREKKRFLGRQSVLHDSESKPEQETKKGSAAARTVRRLWRWAYLSTPFLPACSMLDNEKINTANLSMATIGGISATLGIVMGGIVGIRAIVRHVKNKMEKTN